jgi:deoxyribonuclease V
VTRSAQIAFLDVAYTLGAAGVACLLADTWMTATPTTKISRCLPCAPADYVPGQFYKRELPLLRAVIDGLTSRPSMLVIDGYVWLGATGAPGLGAHLFEELHSTTPIVGVAKTRYRNDTWSERVYRGESRKPLYVTAAGVESAKAAALVASMHGKHRIPTLLKLVDRLARAAAAQGCLRH